MYKIKETVIRKLAKSHKYQTLYSRVKDINNFCLFNNSHNFSYLQCLFLDWLELYNSLYTDLAREEEHMSSEVIEDDLRAEAYLVWKTNKKTKIKTSDKKLEKRNEVKITPTDIPKIIFTEKRT
jgi:hypothetical protein